ncbi:polysaccharide deacetylase family protein [Streptomyces sp. NPDC001922]|uniref:polysaccharide deacetylase family protein n=1 Tax=Streptomyces sp. NPDC001922 TaxID=3364624 RepID=UPI0036CD85C4
MVNAPLLRRAAAGTVLAAAAWHIGPAATWLPAVRRTLGPALDGQGDHGHVALTFDDGPDPRSTPLFLRELDRLSVRATFFVLGSALERHRALGREIVTEGHELAVHGWHHEHPWTPRPRRDAHELRRTVEAVRRLAGRRPLWYRPPYGILTAGRWAAARRAGLQPVLWSAWGRDWTARASPDTVLAELNRTLRGGTTVLLHDSDSTGARGAWRAPLGALPDLIAACREHGLAVGPLAEHGVRGHRGPVRPPVARAGGMPLLWR